MNRRAFFILLAILALVAPLSASADVRLAEPDTGVLSNGLMGYWPLDGNTLNWTTGTVADLSGNAVNATMFSMSTTSSPTPGVIGGALKFTGSNYLQTGTFSSVPTSVSIAVWVKPNAAGGVVIDELGQAGVWHDSQIEVETNNSIKACIWTSGSSCVTAATGITYGKWYEVVLVYNSSTQILQSYVNGSLTASASYTRVDPSSGLFYGIAKPDATNAGDGSGLSGTVDDVRIYSRALSAQEVALLYALGTIHAGNTPATNASFSIAQGGLNSGLVAYWPLDGNTTSWTTGTTADVSGNNNTGTLVGMSTSSSPTAGKIGQALKFNGTTSDIPTAYTIPAQSSATSFTWSSWVYVNPTGNSSTVVILGFRNGATWVKITPSAFEYSSGSLITYAIPTGKWLQMTIVKNGTNFTYYQNGTVVGTGSSSGSVVSHTFYMGGDPGFPGDGLFSGMLDDVRIYNRALTQQEVDDLYTAGEVNIGHSNTTSTTGINSGLAGYWTFDGPSINWRTNTIADQSGNNETAALVNMSTSSSPAAGKIGQALKFNGTNNYISIPAAVTTGLNKFTMSFWVETTDSASSGTYYQRPTLLGEETSGFGTQDFGIVISGGDLGMWSGLVSGDGTVLTSDVINDNKWHLVTATYNGSTVLLYLDGAYTGSSLASTLALNSNPFYIGAADNNGTAQFFASGTIDDVRVYNRALSAQEIQQLYQMGR